MTVAPPELGIDLMNGEFYINDPFTAWKWMRENAPLYHDEVNDLWAATRYADVKQMGTDPLTWSSAEGARPKFYPMPMMVDMDAPEHKRHRKRHGVEPIRDREGIELHSRIEQVGEREVSTRPRGVQMLACEPEHRERSACDCQRLHHEQQQRAGPDPEQRDEQEQ